MKTNEEIITILNETLNLANPRGLSDGVKTIIEDSISGKRKVIPFEWSMLNQLAKALLPGTVTLLCGSAGASKSFMLLQMLISP